MSRYQKLTDEQDKIQEAMLNTALKMGMTHTDFVTIVDNMKLAHFSSRISFIDDPDKRKQTLLRKITVKEIYTLAKIMLKSSFYFDAPNYSQSRNRVKKHKDKLEEDRIKRIAEYTYDFLNLHCEDVTGKDLELQDKL